MKILVLTDDYWHPGEVVERGLAFLQDEFELDFVRDAKDILYPELLDRYPLIINAKMNEISCANRTPWFDHLPEVQVKDFEAYVRSGHGFLGLHAGNSYFWDKEDENPYCRFIGCAFVRHPDRCDIEVRPEGTHPITDGAVPFRIHDEHYEIDHLLPDAQVILRSTSETGGTQVAGYVHTLGEGRMCSLIPGHVLSVFDDPTYRTILRRAIRWCVKEL